MAEKSDPDLLDSIFERLLYLEDLTQALSAIIQRHLGLSAKEVDLYQFAAKMVRQHGDSMDESREQYLRRILEDAKGPKQ